MNNGDRLGSSSPYPDNVNYVRGGQIPLLNNSPTIVLKDGKVAIVFGTPGGETIGQTEFQMLVNVIDFHMPVQQAVENPRFVLDAKPNFYKPGSEIAVTIESRVPAGRAEDARGVGTQAGADVGFHRRRRRHAGHRRRSRERHDAGRRRPAPHRLCRRLVKTSLKNEEETAEIAKIAETFLHGVFHSDVVQAFRPAVPICGHVRPPAPFQTSILNPLSEQVSKPREPSQGDVDPRNRPLVQCVVTCAISNSPPGLPELWSLATVSKEGI